MADAVKSTPGVASIALAKNVLFGDGGVSSTFSIERRLVQPGEFRSASIESVSPDDFQLMAIPIIHGRGISESDGMDSPSVAVISRQFAQRYFPSENSIQRVS